MIGKASFLFLFLTGLVLPTFQGRAQQDEVVVEISEIKADLVQPPSEASREKSRNNILSDTWLKVDVKFSIEHPSRPKVALAEEVKFKFYVSGADALNRDDLVTLTGEVTLVNVPDDKEHYVTMYLAPSAMARYGGETDGKAFFRAGAARDFNVHVEAEAGGKPVADKDLSEGFSDNWFRSGKQVTDVLMPFYDSPWGPSESLRYNCYKRQNR